MICPIAISGTAVVGPRPLPVGLSEVSIDPEQFAIPPAQARAMNRQLLLSVAVARNCLRDAHWDGDRDTRVDVVFGSSLGMDRQYANATRVAVWREADALVRAVDEETGRGLVAELSARLRARYGGSPYDKVGAMVSTIPAQVAISLGLHGRTYAVDAADGTGMTGVRHAVEALRRGVADAALVIATQLWDSDAGLDDLVRAGVDPTARAEACCAVLLERDDRRLSRAPSTILLGGVHQTRDVSAAEGCGPAESVLAANLAGALVAAGSADRSVAVLIHTGTSTPPDARLLARAHPALGSGARVVHTTDLSGETFAAQGLLALIDGVTALREAELAPDSTVVVGGGSVLGIASHLVLASPGAQRAGVIPELAHDVAAAREVVVTAANLLAGPENSLQRVWQRTCRTTPAFEELDVKRLSEVLRSDRRVSSRDVSYCRVGSALPIPDDPPTQLSCFPREQYRELDRAQRVALHAAAGIGPRLGELARRGMRGLVVIAATTPRTRYDSHLDEQIAVVRAIIRDVVADSGVRAPDFASPPPKPAGPCLDSGLAAGVASLLTRTFGLSAPAVGIEAACASSLAAVDLAVNALRCGSVDFALVGGVELAVNELDLVLCSRLGLLSQTVITPFDEAADGFTPGEAAGVFLLEAADTMSRDDTSLGVIRAVGASNDCHSLVAPTVAGQVRAMRQAFDQVEFSPAAVDLVEAHGTGTRVGDAVEFDALTAVYGVGRDEPLKLSASKRVYGHTYAAAGSVGLAHALCALRERTIPPLPVDRLSPAIQLCSIPAEFVDEPTFWSSPRTGVRRAGVSSFGTGGINYHVLLEESRRS